MQALNLTLWQLWSRGSHLLSHVTLIMCSRKVTWKNKNINLHFHFTSSPARIKLGTVVTYGEELPPTKSNSPWLRRHMMSRDKLKTLNVLFHKIYCYQTWQSGTKIIVSQPLSHMTLFSCCHMKSPDKLKMLRRPSHITVWLQDPVANDKFR